MDKVIWLTLFIGIFSVVTVSACDSKDERANGNKQLVNKMVKQPSVSKSKAGLSNPIRKGKKVKPEDKNQPIYLVPNQFPYKTTEQEKDKQKDAK